MRVGESPRGGCSYASAPGAACIVTMHTRIGCRLCPHAAKALRSIRLVHTGRATTLGSPNNRNRQPTHGGGAVPAASHPQPDAATERAADLLIAAAYEQAAAMLERVNPARAAARRELAHRYHAAALRHPTHRAPTRRGRGAGRHRLQLVQH